MAGIGLRKPFFAKYSYDEKSGAVSYTGGGLLAKAVEFSASIESSDDNGLYADDMVAETDRSFAGGSISITTDDLTAEASAAILGITAKSIKIGDGEETVQELVYDDSMTDTFLGFGIIIPKRRGGVNSFRAVVFPKIQSRRTPRRPRQIASSGRRRRSRERSCARTRKATRGSAR